MNKTAWRKKFALPPGYVQEELFHEEHFEKHNPYQVLPFFLGSLMVIILCTLFLTQQIYLSGLARDINDLEQQLATAHRENEALRLEYTEHENLTFVEQVATTKLNMSRPYQVLYIAPVTLAAR